MRGILIACIAVALPAVAQAQSQQQCYDFVSVQGSLFNDYGEQIAVTMQDNAGRFVFLFANAETGTWSIGISPPGQALFCPIASGDGYTVYEPTPTQPNERGG